MNGINAMPPHFYRISLILVALQYFNAYVATLYNSFCIARNNEMCYMKLEATK